MTKAGKKPEARRNRFNNGKDTWTNDTKEQFSLALGSDEYEELLEDHARNAPSAPDDPAAAALEEHNVEIRERMADETAGRVAETDAQRKFRSQQLKRGLVTGIAKAAGKVVTGMEKAAAKTPSTADDKAARKLRSAASGFRFDREPAQRAIYDDGVAIDKEDVDEYLPRALEKYV